MRARGRNTSFVPSTLAKMLSALAAGVDLIEYICCDWVECVCQWCSCAEEREQIHVGQGADERRHAQLGDGELAARRGAREAHLQAWTPLAVRRFPILELSGLV